MINKTRLSIYLDKLNVDELLSSIQTSARNKGLKASDSIESISIFLEILIIIYSSEGEISEKAPSEWIDIWQDTFQEMNNQISITNALALTESTKDDVIALLTSYDNNDSVIHQIRKALALSIHKIVRPERKVAKTEAMLAVNSSAGWLDSIIDKRTIL